MQTTPTPNHDLDEQDLETFYCPGYYRTGEELCLEILACHDPEYQPALLFLALNLAARGAESEALELVESLENLSLFKALRHLPFGRGTEAESCLYQEIIRCAHQRGLGLEIDSFLENGIYPDGDPLVDELTF